MLAARRKTRRKSALVADRNVQRRDRPLGVRGVLGVADLLALVRRYRFSIVQKGR